jgi:NTP pyrophosphatase (non-canonical NTP hydrolase)
VEIKSQQDLLLSASHDPLYNFLRLALTELQARAYNNAKEKGWHEEKRSPGEFLCLMHSELSEALEEIRGGRDVNDLYFNPEKPLKPEGVPAELADCIIRIFDFCGAHQINLAEALLLKMTYNSTRDWRHGGKAL